MALKDSEGIRLLVWRNLPQGGRQDISAAVRLGAGRANPFGWSESDLIWRKQKIGELYCGYPERMESGFHAEWEDEAAAADP